MDFSALYEPLSEYGPAVVILAVFLGLLITFVLRDWKRETRHQEVIENMLSKCEQSIATNSEVVRSFEQSMTTSMSTNTEVLRQNNQVLTSLINNAPRQS